MSRPRFQLDCLLGIVILLVGCSGAEDEKAAPGPVLSVFGVDEAQEEAPDSARENREGEGPTVRSVHLEPRHPVGGERMHARVEVDGEWSSIRYEWRLNGQSFGPNAAEVVLPTLSSGDEIRLGVTPYRAAAPGESFEIGSRVLNQKPIVRNLSLERVKADDLDPDPDPDLDGAEAGQWRVVARVEDPDDDDVEIEYRWWLNGVESDVEGAYFPASQLTRGDRLEVQLRASDGELWSAPTRSGEIEVGNAPPSIVSLPPRPDPSGFFEYTIRAEDPDGDENLRFALETAPRGMQIDEVSGVLRWRPSADQTGRHPIEVVVRDGRGGEATQSFSLALVGVTESEAPGPAAAR